MHQQIIIKQMQYSILQFVKKNKRLGRKKNYQSHRRLTGLHSQKYFKFLSKGLSKNYTHEP